MTELSKAGEFARQYCEELPTVSTRQIARTLFREYPQLFENYDQARAMVRYHRGEHNKSASIEPIGRFNLPAPITPDWKIYDLPKGIDLWYVLSDVHVPYHSIEAIEAFLTYATSKKDNKNVGLFILGDWIDWAKMSKHQKDPRARDSAQELDAAAELLSAIRKYIDAKVVVYKIGNHDARVNNYLANHAWESLGVVHFDFRSAFDLGTDDIVIPDGLPARQDELYFFHGNEMAGGASSPVNPARGLFMKTYENGMVAHHHATSNNVVPTAGGRFISTWSIACMCDLHPKYMRINKWNNGFAEVHVGERWHVENLKIIKGHVT